MSEEKEPFPLGPQFPGVLKGILKGKKFGPLAQLWKREFEEITEFAVSSIRGNILYLKGRDTTANLYMELRIPLLEREFAAYLEKETGRAKRIRIRIKKLGK